MKILEINKFNFAKGGADKHFLEVIDLFEKSGNEVAVFSMKHSENMESNWEKYFLSTVGYTSDYSFFERIRGIFRMFYSLEAKSKINKILDDFHPDIVHIHNIYHQISPCILFEIKKRGIPIVMTVHDYKLISPNYNLFLRGKIYNRAIGGKYYQCFFDRCIKNSYWKSLVGMLEMYWHEFLGTYRNNIDAYIAPSEFVEKMLSRNGIEKEKIAVIPHFAHTINQSGIAKDTDQYALYFGRISTEKGMGDLIGIFNSQDKYKLLLAGKVEPNLKIKESENIKILGTLGQKELQKYINRSQFVVSPSKLPETFGLIALESILNGKPFLGYESGAYPEIIKNGFNGYLAKNRSQLISLIKSFSDADFDGKKIQRDAEKNYSKMKYYENFKKLSKILTKNGFSDSIASQFKTSN